MRRFILVLALILPLQLALGQKAIIQVDHDKLDAHYEKLVKDWGIPGMTVGIVKDGKLVFARGYGVKEVGKKEKPDEHTLYAIASNSKAFTSAIIATLVQEGKLGWDDRVKDHLSYFQVYDRHTTEEVTVRDLLCHRVGFGTFSGDFIWYKSNLSAEDVVKRVRYVPKAFNFRDGFGYSNIMYITAGEVIRKVTGKPWSVNVKERFLTLLGMDRTVTSPAAAKTKGNIATPHAFVNGKQTPIEWVNWEEIGALGGIISSVSDVSKWMIFNMQHGIWKGDTILTPYSRNTMWKPHNNYTVDHTKPNDFNRNFNGYGLGWGIKDYHGHMFVGHTGGYDGMITAVSMLPDEKLGVVVLTNGTPSPIHAATNYAFEAYLGIPEKDWNKKLLAKAKKRKADDTRIADIKEARLTGTKPSRALIEYAGTYHANIYGDIMVNLENDKMRLTFEHSPEMGATLEHWHHDVWEIKWDEIHAWFGFGTVKFDMHNNMNITGLTFDVPNDDIFFEELDAKKVNKKKAH